MKGIGAAVGEAAVRLAVQDHRLQAQALAQPAEHPPGGAVAHVDHHPAGELLLAGDLLQEVDVGVDALPLLELPPRPQRLLPPQAGHQGLDAVQALGVAHRAAPPVVQLEAVVLRGIVRGGDHEPALVVLAHLEEVQLRRAGQADALDPAALVAQPPGRGAVELGGMQARVVPDHVAVLGQVAGEGPADLVGQLLVDLPAVDSPDVVGLEDSHFTLPPTQRVHLSEEPGECEARAVRRPPPAPRSRYLRNTRMLWWIMEGMNSYW